MSARYTSSHNDLEKDGLILPQVLVGDLGVLVPNRYIGTDYDPGGRHALLSRVPIPKVVSNPRANNPIIALQ